MKGFYIDVTNNLLDAKHRQAIGLAVWEFMWCLDKMTSVDENGVGLVLGGKPIKWEEIGKEFGIDRSVVGRNMNNLQKHGYLILKRTPFGHIIKVNKAKKRFGGEVMGKKCTSDGQVMPVRRAKSAQTKKTINNRQYSKTGGEQSSQVLVPIKNELGKQVNELIDGFKLVNPSFRKLYRNTTQRRSCEDMLKVHGFEKMKWLVQNLPQVNKQKFLPIITTPYELEDKMGRVVAGLQKLKDDKLNNKSKAIW